VSTLLELAGIEKSFAGVHALRGVSFDLKAGEVHGLVGENGAGKSTLIKVVTGAHRPDAGRITIAGEALADLSPARARALGVAAIYQQPALFPDLSVSENLALGYERGGAWRRVRWKERSRKALELLSRIGAQIDPERTVGTLSMPEQQLVEIAKALGAEARILIMDEPTASLPKHEVDNLFRVVRDLRAGGKVGVIYISHRMEELYTLADRLTVLRDGQTVSTRPVGEIGPAELVRLMVGHEVSDPEARRPRAPGPAVLELRGAGCRASGVRDVTLAVREGEVVGLAGLVGAGRTELARILFGLTPADSGEILLRGKPVHIPSPAVAVARGIAYVPEDRRRHGVILDMPVAANATLAVPGAISRHGFLSFARERAVAGALVESLKIKTPSLLAPAAQLSGGNQQKLALARWLATKPSVLILDEPTQGIDVAAKAEIHRLMRELADQGLAILMISSDLPEILDLSDQVAVMRQGTLAGILPREKATKESVLGLALGLSPGAAA
jgi:rhamnose transport system ATP-binding protein